MSGEFDQGVQFHAGFPGRESGARGLRAATEEVMLNVMYELPSLRGVRECIITEDVVRKGDRPLLVYPSTQTA